MWMLLSRLRQMLHRRRERKADEAAWQERHWRAIELERAQPARGADQVRFTKLAITADMHEAKMSEPIHCATCGRSMTYQGLSIIGVSLSAPSAEDDRSREAMRHIYPELRDGERFYVCWVCWLGSMGVKGFMRPS